MCLVLVQLMTVLNLEGYDGIHAPRKSVSFTLLPKDGEIWARRQMQTTLTSTTTSTDANMAGRGT